MDPITTGALITGGSGLLGGALGWLTGQSQANAQDEANKSNERIARENREFQNLMWGKSAEYSSAVMDRQEAFQERMSGSAYQRAKADMVKAGLNPMLLAGGPGATTPSGSVGHTPSAPSGAVATMQEASGAEVKSRAIQQAVSSAIDSIRMRKEIKLNEAMVDNVKMQELNQKAQAEKNEAEKQSIVKQLPAIEEEAYWREKTAGISAVLGLTAKLGQTLSPVAIASLARRFRGGPTWQDIPKVEGFKP